jgi:hypothetical protein
LVGRPEGNIPLRRSRSRWEDNTKMNLLEKKVGASTGHVAGSCEHGNVRLGSVTCE